MMGSFQVALLGRKSRCKSLFLKAASSSEIMIADAALETEVWCTSDFAPTQTDLVQAPEHGFSPSGDRIIPAKLKHLSAADLDGDFKGSGCCPAILLVLQADMVFHKGLPRQNRAGDLNPVKAAVCRTRERLGAGDHIPFAVAVSVDTEDNGTVRLDSSSVKSFLESVKEEMSVEGVPVVAVSPRTELWLREQESEGGRVSYRRGDSHFRVS